MDNTGSMATNNNISTLRTAATNFVNILFDRTSNLNYIRILALCLTAVRQCRLLRAGP
ncbi:MAG: hypothetical protein R3D66_05475 [Alphaproteobacteria bacterium]